MIGLQSMSKTIILGFVVLLLSVPGLAEVSEEELRKIHRAAPAEPVVPPKTQRKVLVFSRMDGFEHQSTAWGAQALRVLGFAISRGQSWPSIGDGPFGFLHAQIARAKEAGVIIVAGHYDNRLERIAAATGATACNTHVRPGTRRSDWFALDVNGILPWCSNRDRWSIDGAAGYQHTR